MGVPTLGCDCAVCTSRIRATAACGHRCCCGGSDGGRERVVLIDTGPDFREQALRNKLTRVDAVFYTHGHADHILGLDDLRPLSFTVFREGGQIPLLRLAADGRDAASHLRLHLLAESHLSKPPPRTYRATR